MHIPVFKEEAIQFLDVRPNDNFVDATCGNGGHSAVILEKNGPDGRVLAIDRSPEQVENCKLKTKSYGARITVVCDNFANLADIVARENFKNIKGILFDLGVSSWHLEESGRGFSFQKSEPLDMRFNPENQLTAQKILNSWSKPELTKMLKEYGEERFGERIAREIVSSRRVKSITDTLQLVEIIKRAVPGFYKRQKIHFATKAFQALRVAVNQELANIEKVLPQALNILAAEGRMVVISFHSLEDRIVKKFFREKAMEGRLEILTKKPMTPSLREIKINPRARSAKLRAAIKK